MDWERCILCQKDSVAPFLDPSRNRNKTVCGYVNLENNIEECQRREVRFLLESLYTCPLVILVHELQEGDGIIQNLKKEEAK